VSYRPPYYKMYPQDFLSSPTTRVMTLAEKGLYKHLLDHAWLEECTATLPADLTILAKLAGVDKRTLRKFTVKYPQVFRKFAEDSQRVYNPRQMAEYQEFLQTVEKNRIAGLASGKARQLRGTPVQHPLNHKELDIEVREEKNTPSAPVPQPNTVEQETIEAGFQVFWECWPSKQAKSDARRAWGKIPLAEYAAISSSLARWKTSDQWKRGIIPHAATWLNGKRWTDEIPQFVGGNDGNGNRKQTATDLALQNARALGLGQPN
jgi:uncharacterized protein YdaU (DUF1376 family)